jgi:hypothetical protein
MINASNGAYLSLLKGHLPLSFQAFKENSDNFTALLILIMFFVKKAL